MHYNYKPIEYLSPADKNYQFPDVDYTLPDTDYTEEEISVKSPVQCEPLPGILNIYLSTKCFVTIVFITIEHVKGQHDKNRGVTSVLN